MDSNEFGFTTDDQELARVAAWREAAVANGWTIRPTYKNEPGARAASLEKEGFKALVIARPAKAKGKSHQAQVSVWGPDGLAVEPPGEYDWAALVAGLRTCGGVDWSAPAGTTRATDQTKGGDPR